MKVEPLIKMANQIAAFFEAEAGAGAPQQVATHFARYWEKRMREEMIAYYHRTGGEGLDEVALKGVALMASHSQPAAGTQTPPAPEG